MIDGFPAGGHGIGRPDSAVVGRQGGAQDWAIADAIAKIPPMANSRIVSPKRSRSWGSGTGDLCLQRPTFFPAVHRAGMALSAQHKRSFFSLVALIG